MGGWKEQYLVEDGVTYLNTASIGLMPRRAVELAHQQVDQKARAATKYFGLKHFERDLELLSSIVARLFHCEPEEVAFPFNTAGGIATVTSGLEWNAGDVILLNDQEFPTNVYPYQVLSRKHGVEIRVVKARNGRLPPELFEEHLDDNVRMIAVSFVQFGTGYRADLKALAKLAHENDGYLLVDGIQGLGALDLDVKDVGVDFVAAGAYKWLTSPFGTGLFYCREDLLDVLNPLTIGWISDENFKNMDYHEFVPATTARRFQSSLMPNFAIMGAAIDVLTTIGIPRIEQHVMAVTEALIRRVQSEHGDSVKVTSSLDKKERSGIVVLDVQDAERFVESLGQQNIFVSLRKGKVRISIHLYNDESDVDAFMNALSQHLKEKE